MTHQRKRKFWRQKLWSGALAIAACVVVSACGGETNDVLTYTPPTAEIVENADCLAPDISRQLIDPAASNIAQPRTQPGYPPEHFDPVAVIVCQLGEDAAGNATVEAVRFEGNVMSVAEAFRAPSRRYQEIMPCSARVIPAAGLWFVNTEGQAIRLAYRTVRLPAGIPRTFTRDEGDKSCSAVDWYRC